jgi:drug/metabolite transporter (DMT)-like permease
LDARTRKLAGLAIIVVGIVLAIVGGLADQVGIGANDEGEMGGKQIAALVVGLLLIAGGAVLATVLAKDAGEATTSGAGVGEAADASATPAAGTPVTDSAAEPSAAAEPVEATGSSD